MKWQQISDYAIASGEWTISKSIVAGQPIYTLWRGKERLGNFPTARDAQAVCTASERGTVVLERLATGASN